MNNQVFKGNNLSICKFYVFPIHHIFFISKYEIIPKKWVKYKIKNSSASEQKFHTYWCWDILPDENTVNFWLGISNVFHFCTFAKKIYKIGFDIKCIDINSNWYQVSFFYEVFLTYRHRCWILCSRGCTIWKTKSLRYSLGVTQCPIKQIYKKTSWKLVIRRFKWW